MDRERTPSTVLEVHFIRMSLMMSLMARMLMIMIVHSNDGNFQGDASYMYGLMKMMVLLMMLSIAHRNGDTDGNFQGGGQVLVNCYAGTSRQALTKIILKKW